MLDSNPFDGSLTAPNTTRARVRRISLSGALSLSMLLYLAACGGGGGDSTAPVGGGGPTLTSNGTVGAAPDYEGVQLKTVMAVNVVTPLASPRSTDYHKSYFGQYGYPRSWVVVDLNGDGLDDRVVAPTVFDQKPDLSVEIWINKGDGTVENRTSTQFVGGIPTTSNPVALLIADFNGEGKPDLFISDSGQEESDCTAAPCPGAMHHLFLSDASGKWHDASAALASNAIPRFNHVTTSVGDLDGDGQIDISVPTLGEVAVIGAGVVLHVNNGGGTFIDRSGWLSDETG